MFPTTKEQPDIHLNAVGAETAQTDEILPKWLVGSIMDGDIQLNPLMFEGPKGKIAAAVRHDSLLCCAWTSSDKKKINYAAVSKNDNFQHPICQAVLNPVLRDIFLYRKCLLLHSAGVRSQKGVGLVFIAPSGGGKTTTALSMVRNGSKLLGDDLLVIKPSANGNIMFGVPEPMNLTKETIHFFKETDITPQTATKNTGYRKKTIKPQSIYGDRCFINQCPAHVIYFVNKTLKGPAIEPINASSALEKIILSHAFTRNQIARAESISKLCEFISHVSVYELNTGSDPLKLGKWLTHFCSEHARPLTGGLQ